MPVLQNRKRWLLLMCLENAGRPKNIYWPHLKMPVLLNGWVRGGLCPQIPQTYETLYRKAIWLPENKKQVARL